MVSLMRGLAVGEPEQGHHLRLHVGGKSREGAGDDVRRPAPAAAAHAHRARARPRADAGLLELGEQRRQVVGHEPRHRHVAPGDGARDDQGARLDAIGDHPVLGAGQLGDALDLQARGPGAVHPGPHGVQQRGEVGDLGLARGVLDDGGALGERRGHHEVLGPRHGDDVRGDARGLEPAGPGHHVSVLDGHLGPELGQPLQVLVDGPDADGAPAGQGHARPSRAGPPAGPSTRTDARMVETSS